MVSCTYAPESIVCIGRIFIVQQKKHFCKNSEISFFVFSDSSVNTFGDSNVHPYHQEKLGWPYDTLRRFHIFLSQKSALHQMDYLFYFNANMSFVKTVSEKMILPEPNKYPSELVGVIHPCHYDRKPEELIYDRDENCTAYIKIGEGKHYYQGCLSGGTANSYLKMCEVLKANIDDDESKGIIALWHDESHINRYFLQQVPKPLHPGFAYPETMKVPFSKLIVQLDKAKAGGHEFLRS